MKSSFRNIAGMKSILILILILCAGLMGKTQSQDSSVYKVFKDHKLMGMSVVLVQDSSIIYSVNYGTAVLERNVPITDSTLFRIASISKSVTAVALMVLYDKGLFKLDDDMGDLLGFKLRSPYFPDQPVTVRMVLKHISGLRDGSGYSRFVSVSKSDTNTPSIDCVFKGKYYSSDLWLKTKPGTQFCYTNLNYGLIATLVEKLSGQRFDVFCEENVFKPLGIKGGFNVSTLPDLDKLAVLYRKNDGKWNPQADNWQGKKPQITYDNYTPGTNGVIFAPAGGLRISANSLAHYMMMLKNGGIYNGNRILQDSTVALMKDIAQSSATIKKYGFGLEPKLLKLEMPGDTMKINMIGHGGAAYGLISDMFWNEESKFGFVFLANGADGGYRHKKGTAFYVVEEEVMGILFRRFILGKDKQ
jgi:CubicO group peptidase (beta-lactamase class C family)